MKASDIVWTHGAEADVQSIYERMELIEEGLGDTFYAEVLHVLHLVGQFPRMGSAMKHRWLRKLLVFNRHHGMFYVVEDRGGVLHALLDLRQDPEAIERRLRDL